MGDDGRKRNWHDAGQVPVGGGSAGADVVFGGLCVLLFTSAFLVAGPWAGFHAVLLGCVGLLILLRPSQTKLPAAWWGLALVFILAGTAAFLPARWFHMPEWRPRFETLGVDTGPLVAIQSRMALESLALFAATVAGGLWMAGHRPTPSQTRLWALLFTLGVACYAVVSKLTQGSIYQLGALGAEQNFGFFPNRNHTATYLSMGAICGLGCTLQALRDKRFAILALALAASSVCLWAIVAWSISRSGVVLVAAGGSLWSALLGRHYLGRHGLWAIALIAVTAAGLFLITNTEVRDRITDTLGKVGPAIGAETTEDPRALESSLASGKHLDFRIPVYLDTFGLIREHPWTGVGADQFRFVFPQYRRLTISANGVHVHHPESDWLWMAAETGVPATLALLTLVVLACCKSVRGIRHGRDRALRAGCLVAAMLVPIHGMFDVPGHRITLAWSAVLLFVLSLPPLNGETSRSAPRVWASRIFAMCLLAASFLLIRAQWFGGPQPATTTAAQAIYRAQQLHREDLELMKAAEAAGRAHQPDPLDDKLEQALAVITAAQIHQPLNLDLLSHEAYFALHFDDKFARVDRSFAIARALDPTSVAIPLRQAESWAPIDPSRAAPLFCEAFRRAALVEKTDPKNRWNTAGVREAIRQMASRYPALKDAPERIDPGN